MGLAVCIHCEGKHPPTEWELLVFAERPLLLRVLHNLLLHVEPLSLPHRIHVLPGLVLGVCLFPKMQVLLLCGGHPEGVTGNDLVKEGDKQICFKCIYQALEFTFLANKKVRQ